MSISASSEAMKVKFTQRETHIKFCRIDPKSMSAGFEARAKQNTMVLHDHTTSLRGVGYNIRHVMGIKHDANDCVLCTPAREIEDPFMSKLMYEQEQHHIGNVLPDNRQVVCDTLTWLSAHHDWIRAANVTHYFRAHYRAISDAIDAINVVPPIDIDHRITRMSQAEYYDELDIPNYCSWPYMPYPYKSRVYYVATRTPTDSMVRDYLKTMLGLSNEFVFAITSTSDSPTSNTEAVSRKINMSLSRSSPTSNEQRRRRQKVLGTWSSTNNGDAEREGNDLDRSTDGIELPLVSTISSLPLQSDVRQQRAKRLDKRSDLRAIFNVMNPRLLLVSEQGEIAQLQKRPDYIIKAHPRYINVFLIELPSNAPAKYVETHERW